MVLPDTSRCWAMKELARELWEPSVWTSKAGACGWSG
ncbi:Uncharacterised protein [Klebsiella pneumoniae]|uniref:Uncharacterized protein n=1 Tax=Klebsiella pneumoniae TaxID=573 RepID=A0A2X1QSH9_KLEPN|nr:Uncharacterised protein [Klebsiella pneumoniae]